MGGVRFDACRNAHLPYETLTYYLDSKTLSRMRVPFSILATVFSSRQKVRGGGDDDDDDDDDDVDDADADDDADDDEEDDASVLLEKERRHLNTMTSRLGLKNTD